MKPSVSQTPYHPKWYRRRVSVWWWLQKKAYARFVLRELTSVAVAFFALLFLWQVRAISQGPEAYALLLERLRSPAWVALSAVAFVFLLFHTITWFNLAPAAIVLRIGGKRVPGWFIAGSNYAACVALSAAVLWLVTRG